MFPLVDRRILLSSYIVRLLDCGARQRQILLLLVLPATAFEEDTTERPGVAVAGVVPTAGENEQHTAGHGNNDPDANRDAT